MWPMSAARSRCRSNFDSHEENLSISGRRGGGRSLRHFGLSDRACRFHHCRAVKGSARHANHQRCEAPSGPCRTQACGRERHRERRRGFIVDQILADASYRLRIELTPPLVVQITCADGDSHHHYRCRSCEWHRIEWRGWERNDSRFVSARRLSNVTSMARRAEFFGERFHSRRQIRAAHRNSVAASGNIWPQFRELFHRRARCLPIHIERRTGAREHLLAADESAPAIHIHRGESVAGQ